MKFHFTCIRFFCSSYTGIKSWKGMWNVERLPSVVCPKCHMSFEMNHVLTAQSNQNVIYICPACKYSIRNIETSKG